MPYVTEKTLTDVVRQRWSDIPDPRLKQVMQAVVKHASCLRARDRADPSRMGHGDRFPDPHRTDVRREAPGIHLDVGRAWRQHAGRRHQSSAARAAPRPAQSRVRSTYADAPAFANGGNMAVNAPGIPCFVIGKVSGLAGEPVAGAMLDLWQTDGDGLYEAQRPEIDGVWMRGLYRSQPDGSYLIRTVAPIAYTIPMDGTIGELMNRTNLSHMRPAHIHFALECARLSWPGDASVPVRRQMDRERRGLRREGATDRRFQESARRQQGAERRNHERAVLRRELRLRTGTAGAGRRGVILLHTWQLPSNRLGGAWPTDVTSFTRGERKQSSPPCPFRSYENCHPRRLPGHGGSAPVLFVDQPP